jgi:hypothetical protein
MLLGVGSSPTMTADKQFGFLAVEPVSRSIKLRYYLHTWIAQPYVLLFKFDKGRELWRKSAVTDTSHCNNFEVGRLIRHWLNLPCKLAPSVNL